MERKETGYVVGVDSEEDNRADASSSGSDNSREPMSMGLEVEFEADLETAPDSDSAGSTPESLSNHVKKIRERIEEKKKSRK